MIFNSPEVCVDSQRRNEIRARGRNGMDYLEVSDDQLTLTIYFLRRAPEDLQKFNVVIEGGVRILAIHVVDLRLCSADDPEEDDCIRVVVDRAGDYSDYSVKLVEVDASGEPTSTPFHGFDPKYSRLTFSFKAGLASGLDCVADTPCETPALPEIEINYLAKDFASFRQLILDRLALIMPGWQERHIADEGIALVEILAYVADYLSYYQDAVATEAYLGTARRRISVRRHVRLLDYPMHEGCNARAWIQIQASENCTLPATDAATGQEGVLFLAGFPGASQSGMILSPSDLRNVPANDYQIFEPVRTDMLALHAAHNRILFYTWGDHQCALPPGATAATLHDEWLPEDAGEGKETPPDERKRKLQLQPGDYLLFEEAIGPRTGAAPDADIGHRWVVRLASVEPAVDPLNEQPVVQIAWDKEDALPLPLCLSSVGPAPHCELLKHVSVARGNVVAVDQGQWIPDEGLGAVPLAATRQICEAEHRATDITLKAGRFYPSLQFSQLTYRQPFSSEAAAAHALAQDPRVALPQINLRSIAGLEDGSGPVFTFAELRDPRLLAVRLKSRQPDDASLFLYERLPRSVLGMLDKFDPAKPIDPQLTMALAKEMKQFVREWTPRLDLLNSNQEARDYLVEMDEDRIAHLRFGDGLLGTAPEAGETFSATYRVAAGRGGNGAAGTINQIVLSGEIVKGLSLTPENPFAASGGIDPEPANEVKMFAPGAFRTQLDRAITAEDYAQLAQRNPLVQRAAARLVWTGSRYEVNVAIDPIGGDDAAPELLRAVEQYLYPFRRIGHDLRVSQAVYVPLDLAVSVQVAPDYLRAHVKRALLDAFSNRTLAGGGTGFFYPDNLTFGQSIYLSKLSAVAQSLDGVESVSIDKLVRLFEEEHDELLGGVLPIGPLEVAQLDNDPVYPERGRLRVHVRGGR